MGIYFTKSFAMRPRTPSVLFIIVFPASSIVLDTSQILFKYLLNEKIFLKKIAAAFHKYDPSKLDWDVTSPGVPLWLKEKQMHKEEEMRYAGKSYQGTRRNLFFPKTF